MDLSMVVSLVAALGVGSLLTQYVTGIRERRSARAVALAAFNVLELVRRDVTEPEGSLGDAVKDFEAAALVARLPRPTVRNYLAWAVAGNQYWRDGWEDFVSRNGNTGQSTEVGKDVGFAFLTDNAAVIMSDAIWYPISFRLLRRRRRMEALDKALQLNYEAKKEERVRFPVQIDRPDLAANFVFRTRRRFGVAVPQWQLNETGSPEAYGSPELWFRGFRKF